MRWPFLTWVICFLFFSFEIVAWRTGGRVFVHQPFFPPIIWRVIREGGKEERKKEKFLHTE